MPGVGEREPCPNLAAGIAPLAGVEPEPDAKAFRITVTPQEAGRPINAALKIEPDFPKDAPKIFYANVRVDSRAKMPQK